MKNKLKIRNTRIKSMFKKHIKIVIGILIGLSITGGLVYAATIYYASTEISYDDTKVSGTLGASTVQEALDEIYEKAKNCGKYVKVNVTNGTVSPSSKTVVGSTTTFDITPTTDYGCVDYIDECDINCSNGITANIPNNSTTLTVEGITQNTECNVGLVRIRNFSYTTTSTTATENYLSSFTYCCSSTMPSLSSTYGTFKIEGTYAAEPPLGSYCVKTLSDSLSGSCLEYDTTINKYISCQTAASDSHVCGGDPISGYVYNVETYTSNRTHSCDSLSCGARW